MNAQSFPPKVKLWICSHAHKRTLTVPAQGYDIDSRQIDGASISLGGITADLIVKPSPGEIILDKDRPGTKDSGTHCMSFFQNTFLCRRLCH